MIDSSKETIRNSIFVRIPKTGSTSVEYVLKNEQKIMMNSKLNILSKEEHPEKWINRGLSNLWIDAVGEKEWKNSFTFTFIMNPYDRVVSMWRHICRLLQRGGFVSNKMWNKTLTISAFNKLYNFIFSKPLYKGITFDDFLYFLENDAFVKGAKWHTTSQYQHVIDKKGDIIIDFIGKFENLQDDFNKICSIIGIKQRTLPYKNVSLNKKRYVDYYNEKRKKIVKKIYRKDIEFFNYDFR